MAEATPTGLAIAELARRMQAREISPVEVAEATLRRLDAVEPTISAFVTPVPEHALQAARTAEREMGAGRYRGPLHGMPVALKDLFWTKGVRTTSGSLVDKDFVPAEDATVTRLLSEAGAYYVGKTKMTEFAYGGTEHHDAYGAPRSPWDPTRITGGSSSGSAAAVAAGVVPLALGTDTAGSVRVPAALCGLTGLKPSYGLVSRFGVTPLSWSQDHVGPLAHTAEDVAVAMNVLAAHDPRDLTSAHRPVADYTEALGRDIRGVRIGILARRLWGRVEPQVERAFEAAIAALESLGAGVREIDVPDLEYAASVQRVTTAAEAAAYHGRILTHGEMYHPIVRRRIESGRLLPARSYVQAQRVRALLDQRFAEAFRQVDLIATPTTPAVAAPLDQVDVVGEDNEVVVRQIVRITVLFNPNGLPAISVPCGFSDEGLPIGLQLVGKRFDDALCIRAANAYQQATDWHTRRPAL